jgi:argininosuccinate lyase
MADYLVRKGVPFRNAHSITGKLVSYALEKGKSLGELNLAEYKDFSPLFNEDVYTITVETAIAARDNIGGTAPKQVKQALANAKKIIEET